MMYIGDNPRKDFQAPKQLGMQSLLFENKDGIYTSARPTSFAPKADSFEELSKIVLALLKTNLDFSYYLGKKTFFKKCITASIAVICEVDVLVKQSLIRLEKY